MKMATKKHEPWYHGVQIDKGRKYLGRVRPPANPPPPMHPFPPPPLPPANPPPTARTGDVTIDGLVFEQVIFPGAIPAARCPWYVCPICCSLVGDPTQHLKGAHFFIEEEA